MSKQSHIEQLIHNLCPSGVPYKALGKLCVSIRTGLNPRQNFVLNVPDATLYYVTVKEITTGKIVFSDKTDKITKDAWHRIQERSMLEKDDILFSGIGTIGKVAIVDNPTDNWNCSESVFLIKPNKGLINPKYLMYILGSDFCKEQYESDSVGSTLKGVRKGTLESLKIPVPSKEIQDEVVRLLDTFASLLDNIDDEIKTRERQLELYREAVFTSISENSTEENTLGGISVRVVSGGTPSRKVAAYFRGSIPWLRTQEVDWSDVYDTEIHITEDAVKNSSAKLIPANCVIVAMYGATAGKACINKIPLTTNQACCNLEIDPKKAYYKYVYYWICSEYLNIKGMGEGSQNNINGQKVKDYPIPLPSLKEQQAIAAKLDTIEAFIANLNEERTLRQQQYEYYRAKLISLLK